MDPIPDYWKNTVARHMIDAGRHQRRPLSRPERPSFTDGFLLGVGVTTLVLGVLLG